MELKVIAAEHIVATGNKDGRWTDVYVTPLADAQATVEALQARLEQEREKVKGLHEVTRVICTHCCEPMEIPSKAVLQTQLTQLQALVRAYGEAKVAFDDGRLREDHHAWKERYERLTGAEQALITTLDATTPATKGGDGE